MQRRHPLPLSLFLLLTLGLGACGDKSHVFDRSDHRVVYERTMDAVAASDLEALWPLLTENGRQGMTGQLRLFQKMLAGGDGSALLLQRVRERLPDVSDEQIAVVARGTLVDAWRFLLELDPHPGPPKQAGMEIGADGRSVRMLYVGPDGTIREVRLVQRPSGWYVDLLQL